MIGVTVLLLGMLASATPGAGGSGATLSVQLRSGETALSMPAAVKIGAKWGAVTSVHRSPERNRAVGGAPNSWHLQGRAIDIARRPGVRHAEIEAAFRRAGYVLIESLDEGDHSHFAFGLPGQAPRPGPMRALVRLASAEPSPAATPCPKKLDPAALGRRRPGSEDVCLADNEPAPRYKPLESAP
jgi:hypothetical protein